MDTTRPLKPGDYNVTHTVAAAIDVIDADV